MTEQLKQEALNLLEQIEAVAKDAAYQEAKKEFDTTLAKTKADYENKVKDAYEAGVADTLKSIHFEAKTEDEVEQPSTAADGDVQEFELTNAVVKAFVADPAYDAKGFATGKGESVVDKYAVPNMAEGEYARNWQEHPVSVKLDDGTVLNCLVPNKEHTVNGQRFRTLGSVRQIHFPADEYVSNCRDIGGWKCEGGKVAYGKVIRSAYLPDGMTKDSPATKVLNEVGVTCEIDLRGKSVYTNLGWTGKLYGVSAYAGILTSTTNVKNVFTAILNEVKKGGCVLYHCHAGADRTGTITALLLGVLGVSEADIIKDWELTSFCHWCNFKRISDWAKRTAAPETKAETIKEFPKGELREFFAAMKKTYGTKGETYQQQCVAYLKKVGITDVQINDLKRAMVM